jgi:pteridine reductase
MASGRHRVVMVTGAAKRLGRSIACAFHDAGYRVIVHYGQSDREAVEVVATMCGSREGSAVALPCDFSDRSLESGGATLTLAARCFRLMADAVAAFGGVDVLVNSASSFYPTPIGTSAAQDVDAAECAEKQWAELVGSNAKAPWLLTKAFAELDASTETDERADRCIINITDSMLHRPLQDHTVYLMGKHALAGLTLSAASDLAHRGIRVNAIAPGYNRFPDHPDFPNQLRHSMRTEVPLGGREGEPDDVAALALFLASPCASYMTGQTIGLDGGLALTRQRHTVS